MKTQRLDQLSDAIFAIVMTILAFELKVPHIDDVTDSGLLLTEMKNLAPVWGSFILSFALLFTYWRAHHFLTSIYARNLTAGLANYNALFFLCITVVPFSAKLLGEYSKNNLAVFIYGVNVMAIGAVLYFMRRYIEKNPIIDTSPISKVEHRSGYIRILFPVCTAFLGIMMSFYNTTISLVLFSLSIIFNIVPASSNFIHVWLDHIFKDDQDIMKSNYVNEDKRRASKISGELNPEEDNNV